MFSAELSFFLEKANKVVNLGFWGIISGVLLISVEYAQLVENDNFVELIGYIIHLVTLWS